MKLEVINYEALETLMSRSVTTQDDGYDIDFGCDGGCSCDTGSDWVNNICPAPEWVVGWKKATC